MNNSSRKPRSATTLVEVLVTLSVLLVMGVSAVKILGTVTEIGVQRKQEDLGRASIERLANRFRDDVHAADSVSADSENTAGWPLVISSDQGRVQYDMDGRDNSIHRVEYVSQDRVATDLFRLPRRCDPRCRVADELVSIELTRDGSSPVWILESGR